MGSASSTGISAQFSNQISISETDINEATNVLNKSLSETLITTNQNCVPSGFQSNSTVIGNITADGKGSNVTFNGIFQNSGLNLTANCLSKAYSRSSTESSVESQILSLMEMHYSSAALAELDSALKTSSNAGLGAGSANSAAVGITGSQTSSNNKMLSNIQNSIANVVQNVFKSSTLQNCNAVSQVGNSFKVGNIIATQGGTIDMNAIKQEAVANIMSECKQISTTVGTIASELASQFNSVASATSESSSKIHSEQEISATASEGFSFSEIIAIVIIIVVLILICIGGFLLFKALKKNR